MKTLTFFFFVILWSQTACKPINEEIALNFDCINQNNIIKEQATMKIKIVGIWQLKAVSAQIPNPPVPNIILTFKSDSKVLVAKDGRTLYEGVYEWTETTFGNEKFSDIEIKQWDYKNLGENYIRGNVRMCNTQLLIDTGMALDGPGYYFVKIGNI